MDLEKLTLGDKIVGGTGIVLIITLLFLPWHSIDLGPFGGSITRTAIQSPNGFWGILALLLAIAIVGVVAATRLGNVEMPELPIPLNQAIFYGSAATLALLLLKLIMETEALGFGAWLAILLAGGMTYGGFLISKDEEASTAGGSAPPQQF
jgi:hypothetical protein